MNIDIHALSGAYALDALNHRERADFERHLAGCSSCQTEIDGLRETASLLAEVTTTAPQMALRQQVLTVISRIRPLPPQLTTGVAPPSRRWAARSLLMAAAIALGLMMWNPWSGAAPAPPTMSAFAQISHAPDAKAVEQDLSGGASLTWYRSAIIDRAAVAARELPALPTGLVYELWLQGPDGRMIPAGFLPSRGNAAVALNGAVGPARGAGITVEPTVGSPTPTSIPLSIVSFARS